MNKTEIKTKVCNCCNIEKDISKFQKTIIKNKTYIRNKCFSCRHNKISRNYEKRKYGISREEIKYNKCIICHSEENLCIDHCHNSEKFRGLLCKKCNTAIAYFKEDIEIMQSAIEYIKHFKNNKESFVEFKDIKNKKK